ncbi:hypothetical protein DPMN_024837 [Dreissena polymorpha]|uniref:Uncharacterized protein n=1 Tax=Dreissena polymorpha TaxID=45954 RepID=A0A9D4RBA0_DREPO|nr:hypothetical protein DPMN_024837 [Dreissena polymorpha]
MPVTQTGLRTSGDNENAVAETPTLPLLSPGSYHSENVTLNWRLIITLEENNLLRTNATT